jgi:hypothetical protein
MQDVDGPDHVEGLSLPARTPRPRVETKSLRLVAGSQGRDRIGRHHRRWRDLGKESAIGAAEAELAIGLPIHAIAFLVHCAVVPAAQTGEVREHGRPALSPVTDVMALDEPRPAAREAAAPVTMEERAPQRRRNRSGAGTDLHDTAILIVSHHHPTRVAGQALRRSRGNA